MHVSRPFAKPYPATTGGPAHDAASTVLAWTAFLVGAAGIPGEWMLQDTLKSAVLACGTLIAAWFFIWERRKHPVPLRWHGALAVPLILMAYALGSMVWSHSYLAGVEAIRWFILTVLLFLGLNTVDQRNLPKLLWGIHAGAVLASVWAAAQFWWGWNLFPQAAVPASSFANRNFFAEYAVAVLPLSVWLLAQQSASRWLGWLALSVIFNLVAILMTGTRSALIALVCVLPCVALALAKYRHQLPCGLWKRRQGLLVALVWVLGLLVLGNLPSGNPVVLQEGTGATPLQRSLLRSASLVQGGEYTQGSFSVRSTMWLATARMVVANPWTGVGAGAWEVQIPLYQRQDTTLETDYYAHNEFLQLLSEYGVVVGGLSLAFLLAYLLRAAALAVHPPDPSSPEAPLRAVVLTSLLALLIVSNAGFPWHLAGGGMLLALCLGLLAGSDARQNSALDRVVGSKTLALSSRASQIALLGLAGCLSIALLITWQAARAESKLVRAITLAKAYARAQHAGLSNAPEIRQQALQSAREGMAIHPHYRKLTAEIAEPFTALGDWQSTVWILKSLTESRPHVAALWTGLAHGYAALGEHVRAQVAFQQVQRLKPTVLSTITLRATLLAQAGQTREAAAILDRQFDDRAFDWEMTEAGYAIGYKSENWPLAVRSLQLQNTTWPAQSASAHFRLGLLYADPRIADSVQALLAFKAGLAKVGAQERANYRSQVPLPFRDQM